MTTTTTVVRLTSDPSGDDGSRRGEQRPARDDSVTTIITGTMAHVTVAVGRRQSLG